MAGWTLSHALPPSLRRLLEIAKLKKEQKKAKRLEEGTKKKEAALARIEAMSEEELAAYRAQRAERMQQQRSARDAQRAKVAQALETGQRIVIDMDFADLMREGEIRSLVQQVGFCYSANARAAVPGHLILTGVAGPVAETMRHQIMGLDKWVATVTEKPYLEHFGEGAKGDLVYLTADSPHELTELDPGKVYIVGGLVDRNRHKGVCFERAESQGIATARLPIGEYIKLASSQVMCTNHVVEMLVKWLEVKNWELAFKSVVPTRKRKGEELEREGQGGGGPGQVGGAGADGKEELAEGENGKTEGDS